MRQILNTWLWFWFGLWHLHPTQGRWVKRRWVGHWEIEELSPEDQEEAAEWWRTK